MAGQQIYENCALQNHCVNHFIDSFETLDGPLALEQHIAMVS
jgi:hypothetical protein